MAADYEEGVHYEVRADKPSANKEIREFFSFWCGHCFAMQPMFHRIEERFAGKAQFVRNPVSVMGGPMGPESQHAFAVAKMLSLDDEFTAELFKEMHQENNIPGSHAEMVAVLGRVGIPASKAEQEYISFPVKAMVAGFDKSMDDLGIEAVPEIVVNGKYLTKMESVNSEEEFIDLIAYLLDKDDAKAAGK